MQWNNNNYILKNSKITATAAIGPEIKCPTSCLSKKTKTRCVHTAEWTRHVTVKNHKSASLPRNLVTVIHRDHKGLNVSVGAMPDCGLAGAQFLESDGLAESYLNFCSNHMLDFPPSHFFGVTHCERYTSEQALNEQTRCSKTLSLAELSNLGLFWRKGHTLFVHPHGTFRMKQREAKAFAFTERLLTLCRIIYWKLLCIFSNFDRKRHQLKQCSQKLWWTGCYEQL